jgi:hypothetical protein
MTMFKLSAEHIGATKAAAIIQHLDEVMGLCIPHAGMDEVFTNFMHVVIEGTAQDADRAQEYIWTKNGGASCAMAAGWHEEQGECASWL